jgi:hypothetical protein
VIDDKYLSSPPLEDLLLCPTQWICPVENVGRYYSSPPSISRIIHGQHRNMVLETLNPTGANALLGFILAVSWIFVVLRLYVRVFMVRNVSWDDYLIVASTVRSPPQSLPLSFRL